MRRQDENLGHRVGVEPPLDPAPHGAEEVRRADDEDPVQGFRVVRGGELRGGLHVRLEVPELPEGNAGDVDDVGGERDGCGGGVRAVGELGAERLGEAGEVLVEGEQAQELGRGLPVGDGLGGVRLGGFFVGGHGLGVEVADLEEVEGDASVFDITMLAWPLGRRGFKKVTNLLSLLPVH